LKTPKRYSEGIVFKNTLIGDITQGGLNMIHIHSFNIYLKLSWIKRLLTNPEGNIMSLKLSLSCIRLEKFDSDHTLWYSYVVILHL
jgi:hypothetical protein